jgi:hypothetical protein
MLLYLFISIKNMKLNLEMENLEEALNAHKKKK